jgi:hypothetical protein
MSTWSWTATDPGSCSGWTSRPPNEHGDQRRVATVWSLSLDRVRQEAPAAEALLSLCAFLAPDIPRELPAEQLQLLPEELGGQGRGEQAGVGADGHEGPGFGPFRAAASPSPTSRPQALPSRWGPSGRWTRSSGRTSRSSRYRSGL